MNIRDPTRARKLIKKYEELLEGFLDEYLFTRSGWGIVIDEISDDYGGYIAATVTYPAQGPTPSMRNLAGFWDVDTIYVLGRRHGVHVSLWSKTEHPLKMDIHFVQRGEK